MRVHIITDMEGVSGIVRGPQTHGGAPMYEEGRKLYTEEINAAVRGAKAAGATEIVVMDCHGAGKEWSFNSLVPDLLDPACEWVVQDNWTEYTEFLEEGCDATLLVGMHARAGQRRGGMNHTVSGMDYYNLSFNGTLVGRDRDPRSPLRHVGLPDPARDGRRRRLRGGARAARRRRHDGRRQARRSARTPRGRSHRCGPGS